MLRERGEERVLERPLPLRMRGEASGAGSGWLTPFLAAALAESTERRAGRDGVLARMSEPMFVELVREAGMSRSALAERFAQLAGQPPVQYLAR